MSLYTHDFDLHITPGAIQPRIKLSQYDDSRTYTAHLKADDGSAFMLASGATATLHGKNRKGVTFDIEATVSGADVTFTPKEAATDQPGEIHATLCITSGDEQLTPLAITLDIQKAGATKEDVARSPGFADALQAAVSAWLEDHDPIFTLPEGGEAGQALLSDGADGAVWGEAGIPEAVKTALLACFRNVAWATPTGMSFYDELYEALYQEPAPEARLPSEFQEVEYIESTGTQRILLSNVITDLRTDGWSADTVFQLTDSSATGSSGVLCQYQASGQWFGCWNTNVNVSTNNGSAVSALSKVSVHTVWNNTGISNTINGETKSSNYGTSGTNFTLPNFCIFAMLMSATTYDKYAKMKLYSMKLYKDDVLFADLVPCYRKADGVIGLYDLARSLFLVNSGTGSFLKGGDVR